MDTEFDLDFLESETADITPGNEHLMQYLNDCARHMGIPVETLIHQILKEWAYNRREG